MSDHARAAIRRLRAGVVPAWAIERLSVGYEQALPSIRDSVARMARGEHPSPLFVRGEWGAGKSHFMALVEACAADSGCASSRVELNARDAALNHPQRFFGRLSARLSARGLRGLRAVLLGALDDEPTRIRSEAFANSTRAGDLQAASAALHWSYARGDRLEFLAHPAWTTLLGTDLAWSDDGRKRSQAISRLASMAAWLAALGFGGLVLLLDEAETIDQLWNVRSRLVAYDVLGRLCRLDGAWCIFGVTARFDATIMSDLARGVLACPISEPAAWFLRAWHAGELRSIEPPRLTPRHAKALADRVALLYAEAYATSVIDSEVVERCIQDWTRDPAGNPRRLVRLVIHRLDMRRGA